VLGAAARGKRRRGVQAVAAREGEGGGGSDDTSMGTIEAGANQGVRQRVRGGNRGGGRVGWSRG
jgi:hypothetical protein